MDELDIYVRKMVLENAVKYDGRPSAKSVMGAIMGSRADLRSRSSEVKLLIEKQILDVEQLSIGEQRSQLLKLDPDAMKPDVVEVDDPRNRLQLPNVDKWEKIVMRLAPFPSGPLHVGNARMVVLNDYFVKKHKGKLILVFDDTIGSQEKQIETDAFDLIPEGLEYLGVKWHETVYKSDRMDLFYKYAVDLINRQQAYVCDCDADIWRSEHKIKKKACTCRALTIVENLERWGKMLDGTYPEKAAAVRLKTGMDDPDPAMRDHVILRISETDHPRVGSKYRVWPLLEYSWGIDDHELGISHIIRGKDLVKEGKIEQHIWNIYDWPQPELIYYGRLKFQDAKLSKSKSRMEVISGVYDGWDDPRTWSLQSLGKRGIHPDALQKVMLDLGLSKVDISISMKSVYSENRKLRDAEAPRIFFDQNPVWLKSIDVPKDITETESPVHPDFPKRGVRKIPLQRINGDLLLGIPDVDFERIKSGALLRLKSLANFTLEKGKKPTLKFHSFEVDEVRKVKGPIIHWVPKANSIPVELSQIDGEILSGIAEPAMCDIPVNTFLQFVRVGFVRVFEIEDTIRVAFAHK